MERDGEMPGRRQDAQDLADLHDTDDALKKRGPAVVMLPFPQLLQLRLYEPNTFNYNPGPEMDSEQYPRLSEWVECFRKTIESFKFRAAIDSKTSDNTAKAAKFAEMFEAHLAACEANPNDVPLIGGKVNVTSLCALRDKCLAEAGFVDIFKAVKDEENDTALMLLVGVLGEIDGVAAPRERWMKLLKGVFAGNIFDLGTLASVERFDAGLGSFHKTRANLVSRPWAVDHADEAIARLADGPPHKKAVLFVDNAGADIVLGIIPLARELLKRGTEVILAANAGPSINDITAAELTDVLRHLVTLQDKLLGEAIASKRLRVVNSGSRAPVIDLAHLSPELAREAKDCDLVVLEGQGRGIETNLLAKFKVDALKLGMIKHPEVARSLKGRMFDCVCHFTAAGAANA